MISLYTEELSNVIIIHASGALTLETLKEAEDVWHEELDKCPEILAFDLREIIDIDSISINHLFKLAKMAAEKTVKLIICDTNEHLENIFDVIKLNRVITIMPKQKFYDEYIRREYPGGL